MVRDDWITHERDWTRPGFRALLVYRMGVWLRGIRSRLFRATLFPIQRMMYRYVRNHYGIELPSTASVGLRLLIAHQSGIVIHPQAKIGNDCLIRQNVTIGAASDARSWEAPKLGDNVQVGCGAAILGNVTIGNDVRIGPNAVVTTDVAAGTTVFVQAPRTIVMHPTEHSKDSDAEADAATPARHH